MTDASTAVSSYTCTTTASGAVVWAHFTAVGDWKRWNAGLLDCTIDGPFASGSRLFMVMPDHEVIASEIVEYQSGRRFVDETQLGDTTVRVAHDITPLPTGGCEIRYTAEVAGVDAAEICAGVSSDFPAVLQALATIAERGGEA
jgi:hypothetical protein